MERPDLTGRLLAAALLAAVALLTYAEGRSPMARALSRREPVFIWIALHPIPATSDDLSQPPKLTLAIYNPSRRTLDLIYLHEALALNPAGGGIKKRTLAEAYRQALRSTGDATLAVRRMSEEAWERLSPRLPPGAWEAPRLLFVSATGLADVEPALRLKSWLVDKSSGLSFWRHLRAAFEAQGDIAALDRIALTLEWRRIKARGMRPAWLPDLPQSGALLGTILGAASAARPETPVLAEVFNASGKKGMASEVTKVLRSHGVDVVYYGNTDKRARTIVYDRAGSLDAAQRITDLLGCPQAEAVTQMSSERLVDVTVVLAEDCSHQNERSSF